MRNKFDKGFTSVAMACTVVLVHKAASKMLLSNIQREFLDLAWDNEVFVDAFLNLPVRHAQSDRNAKTL